MTRPASPAAAAGVSRVLMQAGLRRAVEIAKGVELEGYYASPHEDHVRVEFVPNPFAGALARTRAVTRGLAMCKDALADRYDVTEATALLAHPGEMRPGPVLEVRGEWGR